MSASTEVALAVARGIASALLDHVDVETARQLLDDEGRKRANLAADLAEDVKFGPETP
jgi:hypothetical protein